MKLFFRVTGTFRNCTVVAESGGKVLAKRNRRIAVPGEMETLLLPAAKIGEAAEKIVVRLEEETWKSNS